MPNFSASAASMVSIRPSENAAATRSSGTPCASSALRLDSLIWSRSAASSRMASGPPTAKLVAEWNMITAPSLAVARAPDLRRKSAAALIAMPATWTRLEPSKRWNASSMLRSANTSPPQELIRTSTAAPSFSAAASSRMKRVSEV